MSKIKESLTKLFQEHRVIFWYDEKEELTEHFMELQLEGVHKIHVQGNEFEVKYRINKEQPTSKFLLYFNKTKPNNEGNWLLDMELAHHIFHTDQEALFLQEIGLPYHFKELVSEHLEFFKAKDRRLKLQELLGEDDTHEDIRGKILAVLFKTDYLNLSTFIHAHGTAFISGNEQFEKDLERYNLSTYYWGKIKRQYNYHSETPSIHDFLVEVFTSNFVLSEKASLTKESRLLLSLWKDTVQYRESFGRVADKMAKDIAVDVESKLNEANIEEIIDEDLFRLSDMKIIRDLVEMVSEEAILPEKLIRLIKKRENKYWYAESELLYNCVEHASNTIALIRKFSDTTYDNFSAGVENYSTSLYEVDLSYRKFIWTYRQAKQNKVLSDLSRKVEKVYSNDWLLRYNNNWQKVVDRLDAWPTSERNSQQRFFEMHARPFTSKNQRLFVIISDALRYENGVELSKRLQAENRYESTIEAMVSSLPSYTQLGMASLLPHKELSLQDNTDLVEVDGMSSSGIQGRSKILAENSGVRATAIKAEEFMKMNSSKEGREFVKQHDLIYIYHNRIDKAGDDTTSEEKVFEAVEDEINFLLDMMKKIANMNGNSMMITSDHGYLYQHQELAESDFSKSSHEGELWKENRRFVIGRGLSNDSSTKSFKGVDLNIHSDVDILIPKSINRLRVKGAGSRFVHGGASLQEIVIPLVKVTKKRQDTTSAVDIDIIKSTDRITTNILAVSFIQSNLVTEQILPRTIHAAIYAEDGEILSDVFKYNFDVDEGSERQREIKHRFQLMAKASGKYKNQRVKLVLEEPIEGTTKWKEYKDFFYTLNISFTNDFDDF